MSLLTSEMELCTMLDKSTHSDGRGGIVSTWLDGADFYSAIAFDNSTEARIGAAQGTKNLYTVLTNKSVNLQYHDVFRRESDKKIFRVTSDGDDAKTPKVAGLKLRKVSAEEFALPNSGDDS